MQKAAKVGSRNSGNIRLMGRRTSFELSALPSAAFLSTLLSTTAIIVRPSSMMAARHQEPASSSE